MNALKQRFTWWTGEDKAAVIFDSCLEIFA